jgi:hypothetical protein
MVKNKGKKTRSPVIVKRKSVVGVVRHNLKIIPIRSYIFYLIFLVLTINLFRALRIRYFTQTGDAAGYVDVLSNVSSPSSLHFAYGVGLQSIHRMVVLGNDFICPASLPAGTESNFFYYHAYLIGFVFRYLAALFPDPTVPTLGLLSLSVSLGFIAIYQYLRSKKLSIIASVIFLLFVVCSPLVFQGLSWNPYINRLFFGPSIYVVLSLMQDGVISRSKMIKIFLSAIFCISLSERSSLYIGIAILLCLFIKKQKMFRLNLNEILLVILSAIGISWYAIWTYLVSENSDYKSGSLSIYLANFNSAMSGQRLSSFVILLTVLVPFILLSTTRFKLLISVLILLVPIIVVNNSTGNLDSYYAHYQSDFYPLVIAFAAVGFSGMAKMKDWNMVFPVWALVSLLSVSLYNNNQQIDSKLLSSFIVKLPEISNSLGFYYLPNNSKFIKDYLQNKRDMNAMFKDLGAAVPDDGSRISASEELMPALVGSGRTNIDYFPVGVGHNNYVFASYVNDFPDSPDVSIFGAVPTELRPIWSNCIQKVLDSQYELVGSWRTGGGLISLFKRIQPHESND